MELLILAAGVGSRLAPQTDHLPKCLLEIDTGVTILDHQLELADALGIKKVTVVSGFQSGLLEEAIKKAGHRFENISLVYNPFYENTNNLVSLWLGINRINDTFIMMNGDSILNCKILETIVTGSAEIKVPISKKEVYDADDTKLILDQAGNILEIGKNIPSDQISAEWMGVCLFPKEKICFLKEMVEKKIRVPELLKAYPHYLSVFNGLIAEGHKLTTEDFDPLLWAEVDYQFDLDDVRSHISRYR